MTTKADLEAMFLTSEKFYKEVDALVWSDDIPYLDAIMQVCDSKDIDPEDLIKLKLISPILKVKLETEGIENGSLKIGSKLPI